MVGALVICYIVRVQQAPVDERIVNKGLQHRHDRVLHAAQHATTSGSPSCTSNGHSGGHFRGGELEHCTPCLTGGPA